MAFTDRLQQLFGFAASPSNNPRDVRASTNATTAKTNPMMIDANPSQYAPSPGPHVMFREIDSHARDDDAEQRRGIFKDHGLRGRIFRLAKILKERQALRGAPLSLPGRSPERSNRLPVQTIWRVPSKPRPGFQEDGDAGVLRCLRKSHKSHPTPKMNIAAMKDQKKRSFP